MSNDKTKPRPITQSALWSQYNWFKGELIDNPQLINHNVSASTSLSTQRQSLQTLSTQHQASLKQFSDAMSAAVNKLK